MRVQGLEELLAVQNEDDTLIIQCAKCDVTYKIVAIVKSIEPKTVTIKIYPEEKEGVSNNVLPFPKVVKSDYIPIGEKINERVN